MTAAPIAGLGITEVGTGQRLLIMRCAGCEKLLGPEARSCPDCGLADLLPYLATGEARLVSWVVAHHAPASTLADAVPDTSAVVELEEGPWLLSRLVDVAPASLWKGLPLRVQHRGPAAEGKVLPAFGPLST